MYKFTRFNLQITVLLALYCIAVAVYLVPLAGYVVAFGVIVGLAHGRRSALTSHGSGHWASDDHVQHMREGSGLILGYFQGAKGLGIKALFSRRVTAKAACQRVLSLKPPRYLIKLTRAVHTAVIAPVGVGKSTGVAIPFLLTCKESCVVVDFKGELAQITAEHRRKKFGHQIAILDPFMVVTDTPDTFNPLDFIDPNDPLALDEIRSLAEALVVRTGQEKEPHWCDSGELWIGGMAATTVAFGEGKDKSLQAVRSLLTNPQKMEMAIQLMCQSDVWGGMLARMGHQLTHFKDKELSSTLTTTNRFLRFLDTLAIAESTKQSSFDPDDLLKGKGMTVYLVLPPEHMRVQSALLRLWIGSLLRAVVRGGLQEKRKVHFVLDEAASLGHMEALDDAVDKYRGYGVRLQFYYQSMGQLKLCWPEGRDQTLLSNTSMVAFGVNDLDTAKYISERLGKETIVVESGGTSSGSSSQKTEQGTTHSYSKNRNDNWQPQARELAQASEVMNWPERVAVTFTQGCPPIWTWLVRYYEKDFRQARFWPAVKEFAQSVALLVVVGAMAVGMTLVANERKSVSPHMPMVVPDVPAQSDVQFFPQEEER